ncbi:DEAD/DEAH box helicase [Paradevosia shaoguanensis]|uniref:DEAD/DEAH box helicase n=1 Tax=Paradevosia shaoguanensis TaxID=1335043 RepID=UPI003C711DB4
MYDQETASLIRSAPRLEGLDTERLPELLTEGFAKIAAARVRLRDGGPIQDQEISQLVRDMQRLALTNEALVSATPERDNRAAAAFVAGSAHQLCFNARSTQGRGEPRTVLGAESISPDVAAVLLFLVAEASADASEIANTFDPGNVPVVQMSLISAIKSLANGSLIAITQAAIPRRGEIRGVDDPAEAASLALYYTLLMGVRELASELLAVDGSERGRAARTFTQVIQLSSPRRRDVGPAWTRPQIGMYSGPYHLASLLLAAARDLGDSAVTRIAPPGDVDDEKWLRAMKRVARSRPYLWRNHRQAIAAGYLELDKSAAVSFPTGAGKSTLAELKISATLLADRKVIFLAPTNALVGQTTRALRRAFRNANVGQERFDEVGFLSEEDDLPQIFVMTPESCLAQISIEPEVLDGVGLLVFDECHLLHARDLSDSRRALDAMLCLLNFGALVPDASMLLLSAMMKNTDEIAGWVRSLTGRECLSLDLPWKPTRQLRGSVVYPQADLVELERGLRAAQKAQKTKAPSVKDKEALRTDAMAFFGLQQTWATRKAADYSLVKLLNDPVPLSANRYWGLTPNAGEVSSAIAIEAATNELKTLVFYQTIPNAYASKRRISEGLGKAAIALNDEERSWMDVTSLELGDASHSFIDVVDNQLTTKCVVHHGLLLPEERQLCESLYQRPDGAVVMAATSTVAQGMNFPSELVVIAEDSRFDDAANRREVLEAQELLNAAGRAGRAGQHANGIVLVIPGKVVGIDLGDAKIGKHWTTLQKIFAQSDQCLTIDDPLTAVLDRVHAKAAAPDSFERYAIARLVGGGIKNSLGKSLTAYRARAQGNDAWLEDRVEAAVEFYADQAPESDEEQAEHQVSAKLGIPLAVVSRLSPEIKDDGERTVMEWIEWFMGWITKNSDLFDQMFRRATIDDLMGGEFGKIESAEARAKAALPLLKKLTRLWLAGRPLTDLQLAFGIVPDRLGTCIDARKFVLRVIPDLAYLFGVPAFLLQNRNALDGDGGKELSASLAKLGACVRLGFESVDLLALGYNLKAQKLSRRQVHADFATIVPHLKRPRAGEKWDVAIDRLENAILARMNNAAVD